MKTVPSTYFKKYFGAEMLLIIMNVYVSFLRLHCKDENKIYLYKVVLCLDISKPCRHCNYRTFSKYSNSVLTNISELKIQYYNANFKKSVSFLCEILLFIFEFQCFLIAWGNQTIICIVMSPKGWDQPNELRHFFCIFAITYDYLLIWCKLIIII